jgi:hypothetical protein
MSENVTTIADRCAVSTVKHGRCWASATTDIRNEREE